MIRDMMITIQGVYGISNGLIVLKMYYEYIR